LKNHLNKKLIVGYVGARSVLAKSFIKHNLKEYIFRVFIGDIRNYSKINLWLKKNKDINIFINFAAITDTKICQEYKKKALDVNYKSVVKLLDLLNQIKMNNFMYFLSLSTSHVFEKSNYKLSENSKKKPSNYYGLTKLNLEKYILNNQNKFKFKVGIARIFNYYNEGYKKGFFINDIIKKLSNAKMIMKFENINTYRDYVSMYDINMALHKMVKLQLINDYNICSGKKIYLPSIVNFLNKKIKNKTIFFDNKKTYNLVGSNIKLKKMGWKIKNKDFLNGLLK